jgi:hypothetical protein
MPHENQVLPRKIFIASGGATSLFPGETSMCPYRAFVRLLNVHQICHTAQCYIVSQCHSCRNIASLMNSTIFAFIGFLVFLV